MCAEDELRTLLDYELASAKRFRRFVSLVMLKFPVDAPDGWVTLQETIRDSDRFFILDKGENVAAVLMPETDGTSALQALARYKRMSGPEIDIRTGIASFPLDVGNSGELLKSGYRRIYRAISSEAGKVVCTD